MGGFDLYVVGRLRGLTRGRLGALVAAVGGRLHESPDPGIGIVAYAHGTAAQRLRGALPVPLPPGIPPSARQISEMSLRRRIGIAPPVDPAPRTIAVDAMVRGSGLGAHEIAGLALFDVIEPEDGLFSYRDLLAAREAGRLRAAGHGLGEIVAAAVVLRRAGRSLADSRLGEGPRGGLMDIGSGRLGSLSGQYELQLDEDYVAPDAVFAEAEAAEDAGDLAAARRWYAIALAQDRGDPVAAFNLGNVLAASGRPGEAAWAYRQAAARDPGFAEAWLNLGALAEASGARDAARDHYVRALGADPAYADALFALGRLLTRAERYVEAVPYLERLLAGDSGDRAAEARRMLQLCRLGLGEGARRRG